MEAVSRHDLSQIHYSFLSCSPLLCQYVVSLGSTFAIWENSLRTKLTDFSAFPRMTSLLKGSVEVGMFLYAKNSVCLLNKKVYSKFMNCKLRLFYGRYRWLLALLLLLRLLYAAVFVLLLLFPYSAPVENSPGNIMPASMTLYVWLEWADTMSFPGKREREREGDQGVITIPPIRNEGQILTLIKSYWCGTISQLITVIRGFISLPRNRKEKLWNPG